MLLNLERGVNGTPPYFKGSGKLEVENTREGFRFEPPDSNFRLALKVSGKVGEDRFI